MKIKNKTYASIFQSTAYLGSSQIIKILFNLIRNKILAVLVGPAGVGLVGILNSTINLLQQIFSFGIGFAVVRDIAEIKQADNPEELDKTVKSSIVIMFILGIVSIILTILISPILSKITFDNLKYTQIFRYISIAVFFNMLFNIFNSIVQGLRKIVILSKITIYSSIISTVLSIPFIVVLNIDGIVFFLITISLSQFLISYIFLKKILNISLKFSVIDSFYQVKKTFHLGVAFMGGGLLSMLTIYFIRVLIVRNFDLSSAGFYTAAAGISSLFIGIFLESMGKDFYPRLSEVQNDSFISSKIINEQTEMSMLLVGPSLFFLLALAPFIINFLFSPKFKLATYILYLMIPGIYLRSLSWPMGYLFAAKGKGKIFFITQFLFNCIHFISVFILIKIFGLIGAGVGFSIAYFIHLGYMKIFTFREIGYRWETKILLNFLLFFMIFLISLILIFFFRDYKTNIVIGFVALLITFYSIKQIMRIFEVNSVSAIIKILKKG
jgi:PST family polysaccharide transporter